MILSDKGKGKGKGVFSLLKAHNFLKTISQFKHN